MFISTTKLDLSVDVKTVRMRGIRTKRQAQQQGQRRQQFKPRHMAGGDGSEATLPCIPIIIGWPTPAAGVVAPGRCLMIALVASSTGAFCTAWEGLACSRAVIARIAVGCRRGAVRRAHSSGASRRRRRRRRGRPRPLETSERIEESRVVWVELAGSAAGPAFAVRRACALLPTAAGLKAVAPTVAATVASAVAPAEGAAAR